MKKKLIPIILIFAVIVASLAAFTACGKEVAVPETLSELSGKQVAMYKGTLAEKLIAENYPEIEIVYMDYIADMQIALKQGKIAAFVIDEPTFKACARTETGLARITEPVGTAGSAFAFPKTDRGERLRDSFNEMLAELRESGELEEYQEKWFGEDGESAVVDRSGLAAKKGTIRYAAPADQFPFLYIKDNEIVGYEMDLMIEFCRRNGYGLQVSNVTWSDMATAVQAGNYNVGSGNIQISEERQETMLLSDASCDYEIVAVVYTGATDGKLFGSIKESFRKTLVTENRWIMFRDGLRTTLSISLLSMIFGTLIGYYLFLWYRKGSKAADKLSRFYLWFVNGMPVVVMLLVIYYVIFSKATITPYWAAVMAFSVIFGSEVFSHVKTGVAAVDPGQLKAALALGYSERKGFNRFVLPQAASIFIPGLSASIVSLIKSTSVVGYISIQDLTRASELVRSRTLEPFIPLIIVAVVYFFFAWLLAFGAELLLKKVDKRRRKKETILKGVRGND